MGKIMFKNEIHKKNYKTLLHRVSKKKRSAKNLAVLYLVAWVETEISGVADEILEYKTFTINIFTCLSPWQTSMGINAIFLAQNLNMNDDYHYALSIVEASDCDKCFIEAVSIRYNIDYSEVDADLQKLKKMIESIKKN